MVRDIIGEIDTKAKFPMMYPEIPDGWADLFAQFCEDLKKVLIEEGLLDTFYFIQIKEKYNRLICYPGGRPITDKISQVLRKYEFMSQYVCTECGKPASKITDGYWASICDDCWKDKYRQNKVIDIKFESDFQINTFGRKTGTVEVVINISDEWNRYLRRIEVLNK
jgi:hypothetical protein